MQAFYPGGSTFQLLYRSIWFGTSLVFTHFTSTLRCLYVGGHINPAVTLAMAVVGRLKWIKVPVYWLAQYLGAFFGTICVFLVYYGLWLLLYMYFRRLRPIQCESKHFNPPEVF